MQSVEHCFFEKFFCKKINVVLIFHQRERLGTYHQIQMACIQARARIAKSRAMEQLAKYRLSHQQQRTIQRRFWENFIPFALIIWNCKVRNGAVELN